LPVADAAYFIGEDAPKMCGITEPELPDGYQYDLINAEVLLNSATVRGGKLCLPHGTQYSVLVLPPQHTMRPEVLRRLVQLVGDGLVIAGTPPDGSPSLENYPQADDEVRRLAAELWGNSPQNRRAYGKGTVYTDTPMEEILADLGIKPDFSHCCTDGSQAPVLYTHRALSGESTDIYFVTNQSGGALQFTAEFRVSGRTPELWNPVTGTHRCLPMFDTHGGLTQVPLKLEAAESVFVVFRQKGEPAVPAVPDDVVPDTAKFAVNFPEPKVLTEVTDPWQLALASDSIHRGPVEPVRMDALQNLSVNPNPQIRYYSGTVVYSTAIQGVKLPPEARRVLLDLGRVGMMAKVTVNDIYVGGAWTYPYQVDITSAVREGSNDLRVEVVNTWGNRLIGDRRLPEPERRLKAWFAPAASAPLQPSGLMGPVRILWE